MTSCPCRSPPRASTAGRLNWLPAAQSLLLGYSAIRRLDMLTLDPGRLAGLAIPIGTGWLLGACMEARGKQDLWIGQMPEVLEVLREQAIIQSAESSNRIEGVTVAANRLRPLVIGRARPRDRSEEELAGYRAALDWIFSRKNRVAITPDVIRRLRAPFPGRIFRRRRRMEETRQRDRRNPAGWRAQPSLCPGFRQEDARGHGNVVPQVSRRRR